MPNVFCCLLSTMAKTTNLNQTSQNNLLVISLDHDGDPTLSIKHAIFTNTLDEVL